MQRAIDCRLPIQVLHDIPLTATRPVRIVATEFGSQGPESGPDALLLRGGRTVELDTRFDVELAAGRGGEVASLGFDARGRPDAFTELWCEGEGVLLRHVQVAIVVGVDFELVVAPMGGAAGVGCA